MGMDKFRTLDNASLLAKIDEIEKDIMRLRMTNKIGTSKSPVEIRFKRRDLARIKTLLRQRELGQG